MAWILLICLISSSDHVHSVVVGLMWGGLDYCLAPFIPSIRGDKR